MTLHRSMQVFFTLGLGFAAACGSDTTEPGVSEAVLAVLSGNAQTATEGEALPIPAAVRVSRDGSGVSGVSVAWAVTSGGGSVAPASSTTDSDGVASTTWTLGPTAGANALQASSSGATGSPSFTATGTPAVLPNQANVAVGDNFFDPTSALVAVGGQVTWTWNGAIGHNVTFPAGSNSATQSAGTFSRSFPTAGSFDYLCTIHGAAMSGTIVVG